MQTRRDVLKMVPAVALAAVAASFPAVAEAKTLDEPLYGLRTMLLKVGPGALTGSWRETPPGSFHVEATQLVRLFEEGCESFWDEFPNGAGLIPGDKVTFAFCKADGSPWGQEHDIKADVIETVGRGRYGVIDRAFQMLKREVNMSRQAQGCIDEQTGRWSRVTFEEVDELDHVRVEFRFEFAAADRRERVLR